MEKILRERTEWEEKTKDLPQVRSTMTRDPTPEPPDEPPAGAAVVKPKPDQPGGDSVKAYARARQDILDELQGLTVED